MSKLKIHKAALLLRLFSLKIRHNTSNLNHRIKMKSLSTCYQILETPYEGILWLENLLALTTFDQVFPLNTFSALTDTPQPPFWVRFPPCLLWSLLGPPVTERHLSPRPKALPHCHCPALTQPLGWNVYTGGFYENITIIFSVYNSNFSEREK